MICNDEHTSGCLTSAEMGQLQTWSRSLLPECLAIRNLYQSWFRARSPVLGSLPATLVQRFLLRTH
jgi:hypothetical protein